MSDNIFRKKIGCALFEKFRCILSCWWTPYAAQLTKWTNLLMAPGLLWMLATSNRGNLMYVYVYEEGLYPTVPTADIMMIIMYQ